MLKKTHKGDVIVETKNMGEACCACRGKVVHLIVIILLIINIIIGLAVLCKSNSSWNIEEMKVGGRENMRMVKQLYNSDVYKAQQKATIQQVLQQFQNGGAQLPTVAPTQDQQQAPTDTTTPAVQ